MKMLHGIRLMVGFLLVLAAVWGLPPAAAHAESDVDADGLADELEDALAARFFPWVWFDSGEDPGCTDPATSTNPGTALVRVRPHPNDPSKIAMLYVILYRQDCGDWFGGAHHGDVEPFSITVARNDACPYGYGAFSLKTIAHEGTLTEHIDERMLGSSCTGGGSPAGIRIYAAENKHGNYASDASCDAGAFYQDNCSESFSRTFGVYNAGEDGARRLDELSNYQFPGEYAWSAVLFSGSLSRTSNAGYVRQKLLSDRLLARAS
jgi:hypothetical protein